MGYEMAYSICLLLLTAYVIIAIAKNKDFTMIDELSGDFLQQLRGFYYVAQLGSMGQAAKVMHRSQSSVSRLVKQLEQSLGTELFSRIQKGVVLTSEGEELFSQAVEIFEKIRSIHAELGCTSKEPSGQVVFQSSQVVFVSFIAPLLDEIYQSYPKLGININEVSQFELIQKQLEERSIDFAFVVGGELPKNLEFFPLFESKIVLAAPKQAQNKISLPVDLEKLPALPFIRMPGGSGFDRFVNTHLSPVWMNSHETLIAGNMLYQLHMVSAGLGFAILPESALKLAPGAPLAVFSLQHLLPSQHYGLVFLRNSYIKPQARALINFFKEHAQK